MKAVKDNEKTNIQFSNHLTGLSLKSKNSQIRTVPITELINYYDNMERKK